MKNWLSIIFLCALCCCTTAPQPVQPPPMPPGCAVEASPVAPVPPEPMKWIGLAWDNWLEFGSSADWQTGLEGTTNLVSWYELFVAPYGTGGPVTVWLTNRPPFECYRAFNRIRP